MSDSIHARISDCGSNSLSPEPCALIPCRAAIHASRLTSANRRPVDNASAAGSHHRLAWMAAPRRVGGGWR